MSKKKEPETAEFDGIAKRRVRVRMYFRTWLDVMVWAATPAEAALLAQAGKGSHAGQGKPEMVKGEVVWGSDDDGRLILLDRVGALNPGADEDVKLAYAMERQLDRTDAARETEAAPHDGDTKSSGLIKVV